MNGIRWIVLVLGGTLLSGMISCGGANKEIAWSEEVLPVPTRVMENDEVEVSYPVAEGTKSSPAINRQIQQTLSSFFGYPGLSVAEAVDSLLADRNGDTVTAHIPYSLIASSEVYRYGKIASVILYGYRYTGGAHGTSANMPMNFDVETGNTVTLREIIPDTAALRKINRTVFEQVHRNDPSYLDGLFIPLEYLPLPENAALDSAGLHVFYNVYEIAPYSEGSTEYLIPMDEIKGLLNWKIFPRD